MKVEVGVVAEEELRWRRRRAPEEESEVVVQVEGAAHLPQVHPTPAGEQV